MFLLCFADASQSILLFRNDKDMHRSLWGNISKCKDIFILVNHLTRDLLSDQFVEYCLPLHILIYLFCHIEDHIENIYEDICGELMMICYWIVCGVDRKIF